MHQAALKCEQNLFAVDNIRTAALRAGGEKKISMKLNQTKSKFNEYGIVYRLRFRLEGRPDQ